MLKLLVLAMISAAAVQTLAQTPSAKWEVATIISVNPHQTPGNHPSVNRYDVSLKVANTIYVVLYTPRPGTDTHAVRLRAGLDLNVLVGDKTITFHDMLSRPMKVPILSRRPAKPKSGGGSS